MAENRRSEGQLVTLYVTALSNIANGTPIAVGSGSAGATTNTGLAFTLGRSTTGFSSTAQPGYHFVGVLDEDISAGDCPISVWTKGVFEFTSTTDTTTAAYCVGNPVFADSGTHVMMGAAQTCDAAIGSLVSWNKTVTGVKTLVKINPARWRWTYFESARAANPTGTASPALSFPIVLH